MKADNNKYGLSDDVTIKEMGNQLENVLQILENTGNNGYKFISDAIEEDESDYSGSFRIMIY